MPQVGIKDIPEGIRSTVQEYKALPNELLAKVKNISPDPEPSKAAPAKEPESKPTIRPQDRYGSRPGEKRIDTSQMTKPLGSLGKGTKRVPKTGLYKLHKDEAVLNKKDATKMRDRAGSAMGGSKKKSKSKKKKGGKHVHEMHIRHAASGGYIAKHHFKPQPGGSGMPEEPEEHAIPDMNALTQHVQDNMQPQPQPQQQPQQPPPQGMPA